MSNLHASSVAPTTHFESKQDLDQVNSEVAEVWLPCTCVYRERKRERKKEKKRQTDRQTDREHTSLYWICAAKTRFRSECGKYRYPKKTDSDPLEQSYTLVLLLIVH